MKQIGSIQVLRAVAALMVVLAHAQDDALNEAVKAGVAFGRNQLLPWVAGVDLFFVISGFIMVLSCERLFTTRGAATTFLARRLVRIVPLYWLATAIAIVAALVLARHGRARVPSVAEIAASLGFVPFARPEDGVARPIVSLGWTLNYEMFFYVVFAVSLGLRREMAAGATAAFLILLVAAGAILQPRATALAYWSDPIILEFALGMALALAYRHGLRLSRWGAAALATLAVALLALDLGRMTAVPAFGVDPNGFARLLACGLPMAALLGAVVLGAGDAGLDGRRGHITPGRALVLLGDASYALYLFHPLVIIALRKAYLAAHLATPLGLWPLVVAELVAAAAAAIAIHLVVEKPVTLALQARLATVSRSSRSSVRNADPTPRGGRASGMLRKPGCHESS